MSDWNSFNKQFSARKFVNTASLEFKELEKSEKLTKEQQYLADASNTFKEAYQDFVLKNKQAIEANTSNFIIDFEEITRGEDATLFTNIWVQPVKPVIFRKSKYYSEIEIKAVVLTAQFYTGIIKEGEKVTSKVCFEINGSFHPEGWEAETK